MSAAVLGFPECDVGAQELAGALDIRFGTVALHAFPDGESLVRVPGAAETVFLYRALDHPNAKLIELLLAASALRDNGARRVVLVAPYLAYMRQDMAFHPGEAVSQKVIGRLIADHFDGLVTIDPHLHRVERLDEAVPGIPSLCLSAAPVLSRAIAPGERPLLVGPDAESRPWVEAIAEPLGLDVLIGEKERRGDRDIELTFDGIARATGRVAILVDDVISSGETLIAAARQLSSAGAAHVEALATHCLAATQDLERMKAAGIGRIRAARTVSGPAASLSVAHLIAGAIRKSCWYDEQ